MSRIFTAGLSREEAEETYAAWLLGKRPPHAVTVSGGNLYLSPTLPRPAQAIKTEISGIPVATTEDDAVTATAARNFFAWRRLPGRLISGEDPAGLLICDKTTWENLTADAAWKPLAFPDLLTDVLTEKEAADDWCVPEKELKKQRETGGLSTKICKPSGQTALYLRSAVKAMTNRTKNFAMAEKPIQENFPGENNGNTMNLSFPEQSDRDILPLLLVFTPPEAAPIWGRPSEEIRSAAAGAGHRAARLSEDENRQAGRHRLIPRAALETLFGTPDPKAWRTFISRFL